MVSETASFKWESKQTAQVNETAEKVWSIVSDFCNIHEWFPSIDTCHRVEGTDGQPGLIRYCASTKDEVTKWAKERLIKIDSIERCLSYEIVENNVGFRSYVATVKVMAMDGGDEADGGGKGCRIEWSFVSDPVDGWKKEDLESYVDFCLKYMVNKMEMNL